jgi:predicted dehydrogenase/D-arabinose 1-dehydrogenase-like Zn-dependent alcohol dehydrogenase
MTGRLRTLIGAELGTVLGAIGHSQQRIDEAKRELESWVDARRAALERRSGLLTGSAVRWTTGGRAELVEIEIPRPGRREVTLAVTTSVVSTGTERAHFLRLPNTRPSFGRAPGYSAAGAVLELGADVTELAVGDLVAAPRLPHVSAATVATRAVLRVPEGVTPEDAAFVWLGVIGRVGIRRARILPGEAVCVLGAGLIGALTQRLALADRAGEVTVVAVSRRREATARAGGASRFLVAGEDDELIGALAAPVVIDATGDPDAVTLAVRAAGPGGRVVVLGSPRGMTNALPLEEIRSKELRLVGAHVSSFEEEGRRLGVDAAAGEAEVFLRLLKERKVAVSDLVTTVVDPREAGVFYRALAADRDIVAARFDWTLLPAAERARPARLARFPGLAARGLEPGSPVAPAQTDGGNPLAGASGMLRVGLLGCGEIGVQNAAALASAPNTELLGCFDPVAALADDVTRRFGGTTFPSPEALLDQGDLDAVLIAVPHHEHVPLALEALRAGLHVIVEKPLANDLTAAVELAKAAEQSGKVLSTCFPYRYEPAVAAARRLVQDGILGTFTGSLVTFLIDKPPSYWLGGWTGRTSSTWRSSRARAGGGVLIMNLSHYLDLLRHLTGEEVDAVAAVTGFADLAEVEDTVSLTIRYRSGAVGTVAGASAAAGSDETRLELWGVDGRVQVEPTGCAYTNRVADGVRPGRWSSLPSASPVDARVVYFSRLATAIDRGLEPEVTLADGLAVQAIIEAAYRSSETLDFVRPADLLGARGAAS